MPKRNCVVDDCYLTAIQAGRNIDTLMISMNRIRTFFAGYLQKKMLLYSLLNLEKYGVLNFLFSEWI